MVELDKCPQIRVLDYLHQSNRSLNSDSNFLTHKWMYKYINRYYPDKFAFHLTYDKKPENDKIMYELNKKYPNIHPVPIRYYSTNAFYRNSLDWDSLKKNAPFYDIIMTNAPEVLFELISYSISKGVYCPTMTYSHWFPCLINYSIFANYRNDVDERFVMEAKYAYNYCLAHRNYVNSNYGVELINKGLRQLPDYGWAKKLEAKTKCLYMSVDHEEIDEHRPENLEKFDEPVLVFNHRHNVYSGFTEFMKAIEKIIKLRPELKFKIYMTCVGDNDRTYKFNIPDKYYTSKESLAYPEYVANVWRSHIQIGAHIGINQWSLAFLDGMFANLIPFYRRDIFYDEMFDGMENMNPYNYKSEDEFIQKLIYMIENIEDFQKDNKRIGDHFRKNWTWDTLIHKWADALIDTYRHIQIYKTDKFEALDLNELPKSWGKIRQEINVATQRATTTYRQIFKDNYPIKEDMTSKDSQIYRKNQSIKKTRGYF